MLKIIESGGIWMYPIITCSFISLSIILERFYTLWILWRLNSDHFMAKVITQLEEKNFSKVIEICNVEKHHPLAHVIKAGLMKADDVDRNIQRALEAATMRVIPKIMARVNYLSMLANVSTLMGLLGTIMGLIDCFEAVRSADAAQKQDALSAGISVAMLTTAAGLIGAIPNIIAFSVLSNRQNKILNIIEFKATDLFNYLSARNNSNKKHPFK